MARTDSSSDRFVISAKCSEGYVQQTRLKAASAIVLARSWRAKGHAEITVVDPTGKPLSPEEYAADAAATRPFWSHR